MWHAVQNTQLFVTLLPRHASRLCWGACLPSLSSRSSEWKQLLWESQTFQEMNVLHLPLSLTQAEAERLFSAGAVLRPSRCIDVCTHVHMWQMYRDLYHDNPRMQCDCKIMKHLHKHNIQCWPRYQGTFSKLHWHFLNVLLQFSQSSLNDHQKMVFSNVKSAFYHQTIKTVILRCRQGVISPEMEMAEIHRGTTVRDIFHIYITHVILVTH